MLLNRDLSHIFSWFINFGAVVPPKWCCVLFSAFLEEHYLICPIAGNVNFHHLIKVVFPRFLNLIINYKCVMLITKYFVGRYFETMYAISYFHQTFVLVSIVTLTWIRHYILKVSNDDFPNSIISSTFISWHCTVG